jgi:anti-sigma regulatory factor (Ser/Thr protein kinase)
VSNHCSVLVISAEREVAQAASASASALGEKCAHCSNVGAALDLLAPRGRAVVLLDARIDGTKGIDSLKALLAHEPLLMIVLLAADFSGTAVLSAFKAGAVDVLPLPPNASGLKDTLSRLLFQLAKRDEKVFSAEHLRRAVVDLELDTAAAVIAPTVSLLKRILEGSLDSGELARVALALQEILTNAYEHGNLGVGSEEKSALSEEGRFEEHLARRAAETRAEKRTIRVRAELAGEHFSCTVEDEGGGFDWQAKFEESSRELLSPSGRGLVIVRRTFDEVYFNEWGNAITVKKRVLGR